MKKQYIIPVFVPYTNEEQNYIFYNSKNQNKKISKENIEQIIENHLKNIDEKDKTVEVYFVGSSFMYLERNLQEEILKSLNKYIEDKKIDFIRISTTPKYINKDILKLLKKYKVDTIEIQIPATNSYVLKNLQNNCSFKEIKKISRQIKWKNINLSFQIIIGLPESTRAETIEIVQKLSKLKPNNVKIYPALVIKGSRLEKEFLEEKYKPLNIVQAIELCKDIVSIFVQKNIEIAGIGPQNTEEIPSTEGANDVIAGPLHTSFRNLVESSLWYDAIVGKIKKLNVKVEEVEITVNPIDANNALGFENENVKKLKDVYDVDLKVIQDEKIKQGKSKVEVTKTYQDFWQKEVKEENKIENFNK